MGTVLNDQRWLDMCNKYESDWSSMAKDLFGLTFTDSQLQIIKLAQDGELGRNSVKEDDISDDSLIAIVLCHVLTKPKSLALVVSYMPNVISFTVFSAMKPHWLAAVSKYPWLEQYFRLTSKEFYERENKIYWGSKVIRGHVESVAGYYSENMLCIVFTPSISQAVIESVAASFSGESENMLLI